MSNLIPINDMQVMADTMVKSNFYGFKTREQLLAVMFIAQAEGKHPATVLQEFDIIQNRPALKSQAILARFQLAGGSVKWNESTDERVSATFSHPAGGDLTIEWDIARAKRAGVYREGSGWTKYPRAMLKARAISEAVRAVYPACILGHYAVEEVTDFDNAPIKDITPPKSVIEAPTPVSIIEMKDDIPNDEPTSSIALMLPDNTIYSKHQELDDWIDAYASLYAKVRDSKKYEGLEKKQKLDSLKMSNQLILTRLNINQNIQLAQKLQPSESTPK